ncbi:ZIP family zinc transporter [Actinomadura sp. CNU-125]|uniref:ZIP family metal transporter n=1 Tax=Actinomadura sp. CNU-125 TaxID=1904961 RepID=UPI000962DE49|nr:ZIP family metal transporter [Actinomadura sp. CNU-125]OLT35736.1 ZIP family zinc transporter [Actinomadura sp. CNU-125]
MDELVIVAGLAALPAAANFAGGLIAEVRPVSDRSLGFALHAAAGIVIAVVGLEIMPRALEASAAWVPMLAFVAGAGLFLGLDRLADHLEARTASSGRNGDGGAPWAIYGGVALDLFSDGILIGTGAVINPSLGVLLALGQAPADLPEGFAAAAALRGANVPRRRRLAAGSGFAIPILAGAVAGYLALREAPQTVTLSVLAFTGGALLSVVVEEMVQQAHEANDSRWDSLFLVAGFTVFAAVSTYLPA